MPESSSSSVWRPEPWADVTTLSLVWSEAVGATPPLGTLLRTALPERWVRFHYLPDGGRIASTPAERVEVIGRYRSVLAALDAEAEEQLLVTTCGWGPGIPASRPPDLAELMPGTHWRDIAPISPGDTDASVYATSVPADIEVDGWQEFLLTWVADARTADVIIGPPSCAWLVHPYDGGMDVIARDPTERGRLAQRFSGWLSPRPDGL